MARQMRPKTLTSTGEVIVMQQPSITPLVLGLLATACIDSVAPPSASNAPVRAGVESGPQWEAEFLADGTEVADMNDTGEIVGHVNGAGFRLKDGISTALDFRPVRINERGQIAGDLPATGEPENLFALWEAGVTQTLRIHHADLGWVNHRIIGLSEEGHLLGRGDTGGGWGGWRWFNGTLTTLDPLRPHDEVLGWAATNRGHIAGVSQSNGFPDGLPTLWRASAPERLPVLDATDNLGDANGVNARGDIIGTSGRFEQDPDAFPGSCCTIRMRAVLWRGGTVTDLGAFPGERTFSALINQRGQVVGRASLPAGGVVFLWTNGTIQILETPTFTTQFTPIELSERGEILGGRPFGQGGPVVVWVNGRAHQLGIGRPIGITSAGDVLVQQYAPVRGVLWRRVR
jgi:hypothetical protein